MRIILLLTLLLIAGCCKPKPTHFVIEAEDYLPETVVRSNAPNNYTIWFKLHNSTNWVEVDYVLTNQTLADMVILQVKARYADDLRRALEATRPKSPKE